ncbi:MAG: hypothetical protein QXT13_06325 [Pyrobaculum sp.]
MATATSVPFITTTIMPILSTDAPANLSMVSTTYRGAGPLVGVILSGYVKFNCTAGSINNGASITPTSSTTTNFKTELGGASTSWRTS